LFGFYGYFLGFFILLVHLSTLQSFGVPYLAPLSPPFFKDLPHALVRIPWAWKKRRPTMLNTIDDTSQGDETK
jgi:spore germination protein KA